MICFVIPGDPRGKGRHRSFAVKGKNGRRPTVRTYTPDATASYENLVKLCYLEQHRGLSAMEGPISATITAMFAIPKSWSKKRQQAASVGEIRPAKTPDCDNIAKIVLDALNSMAYRDDAQVVDVEVRTFYTDHNPFVHVKLEPAELAAPAILLPPSNAAREIMPEPHYPSNEVA